MIELFWITQGQTVNISGYVQSINWKGAKNTAPRTIDVSIVNTDRGLHEKLDIQEGQILLFKWKGEELFQGVVFSQSKSKSVSQSIKAYDQMIYTVKNKNSYVFTNKTASEIIQRLCGDFQIPMGEIKDTDYRIPSLVVDGETLYDIAYKAIYVTFKQTGNRFYFGSDQGKVYLTEKKDTVRRWVIEDGVNLLDFSYESSIEDSATSVVMVAGEEKQAITISKTDNELTKSFGVIQHFEKVTDKLNRAQLQERVDKAMADRGKIQKKFSIDAFGIPAVITGTAIHVVSKDLGIAKGYYVEDDSHTFKGNSRTMSITLSETDDLQEVKVETEGETS
jgi:hypothetical protein